MGDIDVALDAAAAGVAVVRAAYGRELVKHSKSGLDFATSADLDAERAVLGVLADARPDDRRAGSDEPLQPSAHSRLVDVNCDGPLDRSYLGPQLVGDPAFRSAFGPRVTSTSLAVAWVAAGRRAAYVTDGWVQHSVHFAAGIGLCERAGCVVSDLSGEPVSTGRGLVVAADVETHEQLIEVIRPHLDAVQGRPNGSITRSPLDGR